jgi:hypothetical protein
MVNGCLSISARTANTSWSSRDQTRSPSPSGRHWFWRYAGRAECSHPSDDYEGAADAIEKFLRDIPGLGDTRLLYRMNHMGWTFWQETEEILERARARRESGDAGTSRSDGKSGASGNQPKARGPVHA